MASIINASSSGSGGIVQTADASGVLQLQSNGTVAVTVSTSAFVGIGTASPAALLHLSSTTNRAYAIVASTATTSSPEAGIQFTCANRNFYLFNNYDNQSLDTYDATGVAYVLRQGRSGYTTALQGASNYTGTGISFPGTQNPSSNANTLDDYEEGSGSFSSVQKDGAGAGVATVTNQFDYIKVGRMVYLRFRVQISTPVSTTYWRLNGLPFVNYNSDASVGTSLNGWNGFPGKVYGASTNIDVNVADAAGTPSTWVYLYGTAVYYTDN